MKSFERGNIFYFMVIGLLILIIFSLVFTLFNEGYKVAEDWLVESAVVGFFTLCGAFTGAFLAGIFTLKSVNKQIEHTEKAADKIRVNDNNTALRIINHLLVDFFATYTFSISTFSRGSTNSNHLKRAINEFEGFIEEIEKILLDTNLLSKISGEYLEEVPGNLRRKVSHLKDIVRAVNLNSEDYNEERVKSVYEDLGRVWTGFYEISKKIDEIVDDTSANR